MTEEALGQYNEYLRVAEELGTAKGKGKQCGKAGKSNGSAGKPAKRGGKIGPRQQAQQLKKQRFNKIVNDLAANKVFFFGFVRDPRLMTPDGISQLVEEVAKNKNSSEHAEIVRASSKKTEELSELKRKRDRMRSTLKRGKVEHDEARKSRGGLWQPSNSRRGSSDAVLKNPAVRMQSCKT